MGRLRSFTAGLMALLALTAFACGRSPLPPSDIEDGGTEAAATAAAKALCDRFAYQASSDVEAFLRSHRACKVDSDCGTVDALACLGGCWRAINVASIPSALEAAVDACRGFDDMGCMRPNPGSCANLAAPKPGCQQGLCVVTNLPGG